ncbi:hypothetical protein JST97_04465 [bacterium]|nr:hypothetical protein [bacterium]
MADTPVQSAVTTLQIRHIDSLSKWAGAALSPYLNVIRQADRESPCIEMTLRL